MSVVEQAAAIPLLAYAGVDDEAVRQPKRAKRRAKRAAKKKRKEKSRRARGPRLLQDERMAAKVNAAAIAAAPLLASAGLVELTTAEREHERRIAAVTAGFWAGLRRHEHEAQLSALIGWLRWQALSLISDAQLAARVDAWVETLGSAPLYVWRHRWDAVLERLLGGRDPLPADAMVWPSACWPALYGRREDFQAACAEHDAAGCTREWCAVTGSPRPAPYVAGEPQTWPSASEAGA